MTADGSHKVLHVVDQLMSHGRSCKVLHGGKISHCFNGSYNLGNTLVKR